MTDLPPLTEEEFLRLAPLYRGFWVCQLGCRLNSKVPNEKNPYQEGTFEAEEWIRGWNWGMRELQTVDDA